MAIFKKVLKSYSYSFNWHRLHFLSTAHILRTSLTVDPPSCLQDEAVHIKCSDLKPGENITLSNSACDIKGRQYCSFAHFRADTNGCIDLHTSNSLGGSFKGVFPMGHFITLESIEGPKGFGLYKRDETPLDCTFRALRGHLNGNAVYHPDQSLVIAQTVHKRLYLAPGVETIEVRSGRIRGKLFMPPGEGPFPGVIDLFGVAGKLNTSKASVLASQEIATLSLAYIGYEDLPAVPKELDISYFEEAVEYLLSHPKVLKPDVGVYGISKGGELAMAMGTFIDSVKAIVSVNSLPANIWVPLRVGNKTLPCITMDPSKVKLNKDNVYELFDALDACRNHPESCFPLEAADCKFLFIVGENDRNWNSLDIHYAIDRLKRHNRQNWKLLSYKGAGHFILPAYSPLLAVIIHPLQKGFSNLGGNARDTHEAQIHSWREIVNFFKESLKP